MLYFGHEKNIHFDRTFTIYQSQANECAGLAMVLPGNTIQYNPQDRHSCFNASQKFGNLWDHTMSAPKHKATVTFNFKDPFGYFSDDVVLINVATAIRDENDVPIGIIGGSFQSNSLSKMIDPLVVDSMHNENTEIDYWIYTSENLQWDKPIVSRENKMFEMNEEIFSKMASHVDN